MVVDGGKGKSGAGWSMKKKLLLLAVSLMFCAAILEIGSRLITRHRFTQDPPTRRQYKMDHPVLHHVWVPSKVTIDRHRSIPYPLIINSQGWVEEYDVSLAKPANTYRVFYLGDSNVQGVVAPAQKMVEIVERELNFRYADKGVRFDVINTGTTSYSFLQYFLLLKTKLLEYAPDLVMINVDMTDVVNDAVYSKRLVRRRNGEITAIRPDHASRYAMTPEGYSRFDAHFYLPGWVVNASDLFFLIDVCLRRCLLNSDVQNEDQEANWLAIEWSDQIRANVAESMNTLSLAIRLLRRNGVKVGVTGVPHYPQYTGQWSARPHEILAEVAEREGAAYLNSYEALKAKIAGSKVGEYYWAEDPTHFNAPGNKIWAEAQLSFLLDPANGLLGSGQRDRPSSE